MKTIKTILGYYLTLIMVMLLSTTESMAQRASLEFGKITGDGNPTGNGPVYSTTINFLKNTNNTTNSNFATTSPAVSATITFSNQQYSHPNFSGGAFVLGYAGLAANAIYGPMSGTGVPAGVGANSTYTSTSSDPILAGQGIDLASNHAIRMQMYLYPLVTASRPATGSYHVADMTITFNRPVDNPVLHIGGSGGGNGNTPTVQGWSMEFENIASNTTISLSKLSGTTFLSASGNRIFNNSTDLYDNTTGIANFLSGSIRINGTGITTITMKVHIRGDGGRFNAVGDWGGIQAYEAFVFGLSIPLVSDFAVTKTVNSATLAPGGNAVFTMVATNNGPDNGSGVTVQDLLPSGYTYVSHTATNGNANYNQSTGLWTIGTLNSGATETLTITATVKASGTYANTATITGNENDLIPGNNTSTVTPVINPCMVSPTNPDTDGDGVSDYCDLDDDNDGILDADESPGCFYTSQEAQTLVRITSPFNGASGDPTASNDIPALYNRNTSDTNPFNFAGQTITSGTAIFNISYPTSILLSSLAVTQTTNGMVSTTSRYGVLYGSNDGVDYTAISAAAGEQLHTATVTFTVTSSTPYRYYQIRYIGTASGGNATSGLLGTANIQEITPVVNATNYMPSANPKPGACLSDIDADGIANYLDNDADGDGCPDAREGDENVLPANIDGNGRITGGVNSNGIPNLVNSGGAADIGGDLGQGIGRAFAKIWNECASVDSDGDGITNDVDLDDDNDGILDTDEGYAISTSVYTMNIPSSVTNANASFGTNGGSFNLVYNLTSGTAVAGLGTSFNVPFTFTDFSNTATGVNHTWQSAFDWSGILSILPNTASLYTSLPVNNTTAEEITGSPSALTITDDKIRWLLLTNRIDQLGTFKTTIGDLPSTTGQLSSYSTQTNLRLWSVHNASYTNTTDYQSAYYARMIDLVSGGGEGTTATYTTNYGRTENWLYTAFDNSAVAGNAENSGYRGLISVLSNTITYVNHRDTDGDGTPDYLDLDSDGDGCFDAVEGDENVVSSNLNGAGSITGTVNANGVPNLVNSGGAADIGADVGQGIGSSQSVSIVACCFNDPATGTPDSYTQTGISSLEGFGNGWPNNVPNGFIAIESKNQGFVITRVANTSVITDPAEGMLVYDLSNSPPCVKLYNGSAWKCLAKDCN
ncbi:DUF11 domain-containing protein [Flavobacterium sp. PLA-1-15]|uniref:DUF11 domain-containing protein n=1 Tax=Flavobacterium sp. PLA-1-15 TaxID=3380533 RepID=UPI003B7A8E04